MNEKLARALAVLDAAGGRLSLMGDRLQVDVDQELPESVWSTLASHKLELIASLGGGPPAVAEPEPARGESPVWPERRSDPDTLPLPAGVECCDRCGSTETTDTDIHGGRSVRRDCARCGRFRKFVTWYGVRMP